MAQAIIMKAVVMCSIPFLGQHFILFLIFIIYNLVGWRDLQPTNPPTTTKPTNQPTIRPTDQHP